MPLGPEITATDARNQRNVEFRVDVIKIDILFFESFSRGNLVTELSRGLLAALAKYVLENGFARQGAQT